MEHDIEEYNKKYREVRTLGIGSYGCVSLIEERKTKRLYAAKKNKLNRYIYESAKKELEFFMKLQQHPNLVSFVEYFHSPADVSIIIILEFCDCKFLSFSHQFYFLRWKFDATNRRLERTRRASARRIHQVLPCTNCERSRVCAQREHVPLRHQAR